MAGCVWLYLRVTEWLDEASLVRQYSQWTKETTTNCAVEAIFFLWLIRQISICEIDRWTGTNPFSQNEHHFEMEYTVVRDNENPHWNSLLRNVRQLNDELRQLSNYYLGNNVMATITDHEKLPKATSNVANACLEVTDATCVVMANFGFAQYDCTATPTTRCETNAPARKV